jgi:hypothetical protein
MEELWEEYFQHLVGVWNAFQMDVCRHHPAHVDWAAGESWCLCYCLAGSSGTVNYVNQLSHLSSTSSTDRVLVYLMLIS